MSMQQTNSGAESGAASYAMSGASATRRASGAVRGELGFYSALASAIEGCKQGEAAAQGWSDLIKGLVNKGLAKQDEVEWTGLEDWLSLQDGRISKEQVLDYLEQHGVQVVEDRLAAGNKEWFVRDRSSLEVIESGFESEDAAQIWAEDNLGTSFREQYKILQNDESTGDARYGDYTQRGGTNYREIILRLPESRVLPQRERFSLFHGGTLIAQGMWPPSRRTQESLATNPNLRVQREWVPDQNEARRQGVYLPTHWAQTNVLAHLRLTDRVGVDGRQVLFVEEIQSDWAQDGRRNGFAQKTQGEASGAAGSVPVGPFVTKTEGWLSLALKRVLVMAAEGGYEAVAFISGEQSAARYKLAQPIDRAAITRTGGVWAVTAWHKDSAAITRDVTTDAALRELVGKELAARAIADGGGEYKGLNLSFGGNGMRAFYDTIVPNTLKALLKKLGIDAPMQAIKLQGASAEMAAFPAGEKWVVTDAEDGRIEHGKFATLKEAMDFMRGAASQQVSLPVTEALRERVRTGMPLFSRKGRTQGVTPSAAANEPPTGSESKSIEDAGEKIGGARKDRWRERGLNLDDLNSMSESEGAEMSTKANVWKPDYEALSQAADPVTAAMVKVIYDRLAAKPKKNTPEGRRQYVKMMQMVRDVYGAVRSLDAARIAYFDLRQRVGLGATEPRAKEEALSLLFSVYKGRGDPFTTDYSDLSKAKKMVEEGFPEKAEPLRKRLTLRAEGGSGTTERGFELYAATKQDAEAAAKTIYERDVRAGRDDKDGKADPERPHLDDLKRENLPQRIDRDVTAEDFIRDFGFRGVEFGKWSAQDERQRSINMAYDGLMDLADIMGVPPKAISLNGSLGMAFGARGGGRFAAHYEPGKMVINMTKLRGGGSLAHEWAHAVDHYFGELNTRDAYTTDARGASGWADEGQYGGLARQRAIRVDGEWKSVTQTRLENLRPEMARAFDRVMQAIFQKQVDKAAMVRSKELDLERTEALANKELDPKMKDMYQRIAADRHQALEELRKAPEDKMYVDRGRSEFARQAQALSGKSTSGYWVRPTEMFARAFESWVFDRVMDKGARSDYLVHGVESDRFAGGGYRGNPYPVGEERARINAAFEGLIKTLKVQETERGVMLFEPDAEYADEDERITRISHPVTDDQLLQKFLDEGPVESQTGSAAKASQREAASAVKDIRSTATPLGRVLSRDYAARQRINLVGQKIESAQDLAVLAQVYRDPRFETFRVLFVNDVGDVVSQVGLTSRLPASVQVIMGDDMDAYLAELSTAARSSGATGYYLLHNHPSGVATPSQADINLTKQFAAKMPGLNLHRHVVIDTNEYACIDGDGEFELMKIDLGRPALFTAPEWDGLNISGPKDVMAVAKRLQADQGAVTLIHTDSQHKVRFVDAIPPSVAMSDQETVRRHVLKVSLRHGGAKVFAVSRNKLALARMSDLIVDGIHVNDLGHTWSMMENGAMPGGQLFPQTRRARLSPDTSPEFAYLRSTPSSARQMDAKDPGLKTVDQINSGSFKRWFGDSKVVDSYGRPLRVYHGSVGKRTVFESHWRQLERDALPHELIGSGSIAQIYKQAKEEPELHFFAALRDTAETYGPDVTEAYLQIANMVGNPDMASHEAIELMLQLDADGAIFRETTSSGAPGGVAYVVRKSSQIKSAVDNMGAFDPGEADIRLSRDIPGIGAGESGHIRSALKQAYGTLLEQLESASLVRLNRNLEAALDAAAQARSLRSGVDVAQERQMLASHMLASHTFAGHAPAGHAPAGYVTSAAGIDVKRSAAGDIQGFFDPVAQQAYLIEEHLTPSSAPGVLMHEIGVHMAYDRADSPQQRQLMRAFVRARQILSEGAQHTSDPGLAAAIQQASDRMSDAGETSAEEAAAYLVEAIENHRIRHLAAQQDPSNLGEVLGGWLQETASSVRAWLFSKGVLIDAQDLTAYDIAALARGKAHNLASESSSNRLRKDLTRSLDHALTMAGTRARRFSLRVAEIINPPHQPLGLYSALQSEVGSARASALTATGWKDVVAGWVNKGTVKSAEVEWSGLVEWLDLQDGQSGRVSRQEVMTYLMAHGVRVEEVERTEKTVIPQKERAGQLETQAEAGSGPKYQRYTLPGGSNYREVLLKLPARPGRHTLRFADGKHRIWSNDKQDWARRPDGVLLRSYDSEADGLRAMGVMGGAHSRNFCDNHWGEVNVLAHLRLDDRIDAEGRKTLFVEEVQSDWGQIGKRGGFAKIGSGDPSGIQLGSVPDAPFVTKTEGWLSLALKRVLVMAAEGGYEAVAFISGEQSAARYDLSKQIDRAHIARTDDAWAVHAWKNGTKVITRVASKNDELQEIIGKDLAERAIADGGGEYQGLDLQVGGKGMRAFYDVILPNTLKSIFKKMGTGKLDSVRFGDDRRSYDETQALLNDYAAYPIGSSDRQALLDYLDVAPDYGYSSIRGTQTGFAVTDDLREKVSHGLPLFSRRGLADADLDADDRSEDDKSRCNPEARDDLEPDEHQKSDLAPRC